MQNQGSVKLAFDQYFVNAPDVVVKEGVVGGWNVLTLLPPLKLVEDVTCAPPVVPATD